MRKVTIFLRNKRKNAQIEAGKLKRTETADIQQIRFRRRVQAALRADKLKTSGTIICLQLEDMHLQAEDLHLQAKDINLQPGDKESVPTKAYSGHGSPQETAQKQTQCFMPLAAMPHCALPPNQATAFQ